MQQVFHTWIWDPLPFLLADPLQFLSGWMVNVGGQPFLGLSRDAQLGLSQGSGWAIQEHHGVVVKPLLRLILAVCLGSLSCWKVNLRPSLRSWALWRRFSSRISLYLAAFIFPSIATSRPVPAAENTPTAWCCHHHASLLGLYWTGDEQCLFFLTHTLRIKAKKFYLGLIRPENPSGVFLANSMRAFMCLALRRGFRRATLP